MSNVTLNTKPKNVITLKKMLETAEKGGYAVGSFSPRYTKMIRPILKAGQKSASPLIIQISERELMRYELTSAEFAKEFYKILGEEEITVPVALHLDHTKDFSVLKDAILAGFTSVMIDASEHNLETNIEISKEVAKYAHSKGASVEAELGKIGTTDFVETESDEELYTDPQEALQFVSETNIDALAVSVGTAHGVYAVKEPKIDYDRLKAIRAITPVHLVLHGGSDVPSEMIQKAINLENGGISKVNIATDLENSLLHAIGRSERMTNEECNQLPINLLEKGQQAVENTVIEKIQVFLKSNNRASDFKL